MRVDLLIRGAKLLEADAVKKDGVRFDLGTWASPYDTSQHNKIFDTQNKPPLSCDTKACAMGLFCLSGAFKKEGLSYELEGRAVGYVCGYVLSPTYVNGDVGFAAAAALFDISYNDAETLFSAESYDNTRGAEAELAVAERMRQLAAGENIFPDSDDED